MNRGSRSRRGTSGGVRPLAPRPGVEGCVIDAHIHVMSGRCTPLPTVWYNGKITEVIYRLFPCVYKSIRWGDADGRDVWAAYLTTLRRESEALPGVHPHHAESINIGARIILRTAMHLVRCISTYGWSSAPADQVTAVVECTDHELASNVSIRYGAPAIAGKLRALRDEHGKPYAVDTVEAALNMVTLAARVARALLGGEHARNEQMWREVLIEAAELGGFDSEQTLELLKNDLREAFKALCREYCAGGLFNALDPGRPLASAADVIDLCIRTLHHTPIVGLLTRGLSGICSLLALQKRTTQRIASLAMLFNHDTHGPEGALEWYPMITLTMDIDYAHLDGYQGRPIYVEMPNDTSHPPSPQFDETQVNLPTQRYGYYRRTSTRSRGELRELHELEAAWYEDWKEQVEDTVEVVSRYPWRLLPLYHYDPRRWIESPHEPFEQVVSVNASGTGSAKPQVFIGFKMYPPLGYKPADPRLPGLDAFYRRCRDQQIPIVSHCSPGGLMNQDRELFYTYDCEHGLDHSTRRRYDALVEKYWLRFGNRGAAYGCGAPVQHDAIRRAECERNIFYFQEEYGSPRSWEAVLKKYPTLRLCLAHFGGRDRNGFGETQSGWDSEAGSWEGFALWNEKIIELIDAATSYPNLYTDISYFPCLYGSMSRRGRRAFRRRFTHLLGAHPALHDKILFGSDWYMIVREKRQLDMRGYVRKTRELLRAITEELGDRGQYDPSYPDLWTRFAILNPFRFYQIEGIRTPYSTILRTQLSVDERTLAGAHAAVERVAREVAACEAVMGTHTDTHVHSHSY